MGPRPLKVFSKPSTQARVSASEKGREVHVWRPPRLRLEMTRGPRLATSASDIGTRGLRLATSASDIGTQGLRLLEEFELKALQAKN